MTKGELTRAWMGPLAPPSAARARIGVLGDLHDVQRVRFSRGAQETV